MTYTTIDNKYKNDFPAVLGLCWLGNRKGSWPVEDLLQYFTKCLLWGTWTSLE